MNWLEAEGEAIEGKVTQGEVDQTNAERLGKTFEEFNAIKQIIGLMQTDKKRHSKTNYLGGEGDQFKLRTDQEY